jgi:ribosomal protein S18 acetylase RimI-like enzyme
MQIIPARPENAEALTAIAFAAKRYWGYPERWIERWREQLTMRPEFIVQHETYAAVIGDRLMGFYALGQSGNRSELLHLWVLPDAMGRGIGRALFLHAVERVKASGGTELLIESDPNAAGFYQRLGARHVGTSIRDLEQQRRELPILVYAIDRKGERSAAAGAAPPR